MARTLISRTLSAINVVLALIGVFDVHTGIWAFSATRSTLSSASQPLDFPYLAQVFWTMTAINLIFQALLVVCALYLWRASRAARFACNLLFVAELVYRFLEYPVKFMLLEWGGDKGLLLRNTIAVLQPLGNSGLSLQFQIWYPAIALVLLNIGYLLQKSKPRQVPSALLTD
jgi:hypothetical protein